MRPKNVGFANMDAIDRVVKGVRDVESMRGESPPGSIPPPGALPPGYVAVKITSTTKVDDYYPGKFYFRNIEAASEGDEWKTFYTESMSDNDHECYVQSPNKKDLAENTVYTGYVAGVFEMYNNLGAPSGEVYNGFPLVIVNETGLGTLDVQEVDEDPIVLKPKKIEFDQEDGFKVSQTGTTDDPKARIDICNPFKLMCLDGYMAAYKCVGGEYKFDFSTSLSCESELRTGGAPFFDYTDTVCPIFASCRRVTETGDITEDDSTIEIEVASTTTLSLLDWKKGQKYYFYRLGTGGPTVTINAPPSGHFFPGNLSGITIATNESIEIVARCATNEWQIKYQYTPP